MKNGDKNPPLFFFFMRLPFLSFRLVVFSFFFSKKKEKIYNLTSIHSSPAAFRSSYRFLVKKVFRGGSSTFDGPTGIGAESYELTSGS